MTNYINTKGPQAPVKWTIEDDPGTGATLLLYIGTVGVYDILCSDVETAKSTAQQKHNVPLTAWQQSGPEGSLTAGAASTGAAADTITCIIKNEGKLYTPYLYINGALITNGITGTLADVMADATEYYALPSGSWQPLP